MLHKTGFDGFVSDVTPSFVPKTATFEQKKGEKCIFFVEMFGSIKKSRTFASRLRDNAKTTA